MRNLTCSLRPFLCQNHLYSFKFLFSECYLQDFSFSLNIESVTVLQQQCLYTLWWVYEEDKSLVDQKEDEKSNSNTSDKKRLCPVVSKMYKFDLQRQVGLKVHVVRGEYVSSCPWKRMILLKTCCVKSDLISVVWEWHFHWWAKHHWLSVEGQCCCAGRFQWRKELLRRLEDEGIQGEDWSPNGFPLVLGDPKRILDPPVLRKGSDQCISAPGKSGQSLLSRQLSWSFLTKRVLAVSWGTAVQSKGLETSHYDQDRGLPKNPIQRRHCRWCLWCDSRRGLTCAGHSRRQRFLQTSELSGCDQCLIPAAVMRKWKIIIPIKM